MQPPSSCGMTLSGGSATQSFSNIKANPWYAELKICSKKRVELDYLDGLPTFSPGRCSGEAEEKPVPSEVCLIHGSILRTQVLRQYSKLFNLYYLDGIPIWLYPSDNSSFQRLRPTSSPPRLPIKPPYRNHYGHPSHGVVGSSHQQLPFSEQ